MPAHSHANDKIPVLDLNPEIDSLWAELNSAFQRVLKSGQFINGPDVKLFEDEFAAYLGVKHAVGMNSGTDALYIALRAMGIGVGDEVITTPFTFFATAEAISHVGATPVFVDIDPETYNIDTNLIEAKLSARTKAIIPVHLYGHAAEMAKIEKVAHQHKLQILEDVAQAFSGSFRTEKNELKKLGAIGAAGAFSFFPSKNLGAFGDAGLMTTNDDAIAEKAKMLRAHGAKKKYFNETVGYNSRLDTLQAAMLRVKLPHIDAQSRGRRLAASRYNEMLSRLPGVRAPIETSYAEHVYHQYTIRIDSAGNKDRRDTVQKRLAEAGVETMLYYPVPLHKLPVYQNLNLQLPEAEKAALEALSLPIWPNMPVETQERVVRALSQAL